MRIFCFLLISCLALVAEAGELPMIEKIYQDQDVPLQASVGGQIFKLIRKESIRDTSGQIDAFGRSYDRGFRELRYRGVTADGKPVLRYLEVAIQPGGAKVPMKLGSNNNKAKLPVGIVTYARDAAIPATAGKAETLPADATDIVMDLSKSREFRFGTLTIVISKADKSAIEYTLHQNFAPAR